MTLRKRIAHFFTGHIPYFIYQSDGGVHAPTNSYRCSMCDKVIYRDI